VTTTVTKSATRVIYESAGAPPMPGSEAGPCRTCGMDAQGVLFNSWVKDTFTDHASLHPGEIVCHACLMLFENRSVLYQRLLGREKPQKPWNWSHFVVDGQYVVLSKADKMQMRGILARSPAVAVIAESGQKHLAFRAKVGMWQFEFRQIPAAPGLLAQILEVTDALYSAGATKTEIETGRYSAASIQRVGLSEWRRRECSLREQRGTPLFELACFLTLKGSQEDEPDR
jgi:hypothetical protein